MIFVILGTQKFQLNRLLKQMDQYVASGLIKEEVIAQIGLSDYHPVHYKYFTFVEKRKFQALIENADLIITHSGVGSIISALSANKPVIVFPRMAKYHEHVDDHQLEIAHAFSQKKYVLCCQAQEELIHVIEKSKIFSFCQYQSQTQKVVSTVKGFIDAF